MALYVNTSFYAGVTGSDVTFKKLADDRSVASVNIAYSEKGRDGNKVTMWLRVVGFGKTAEIMNAYVGKGSNIHVTGKLVDNKWTGKDGVQRNEKELLISDLRFAGELKKPSASEPQQPPVSGDEIPF